MSEVPPAMLAALNSAPGEIGDLFRHFFGEFDFEGITPVLPTTTFSGKYSCEVGGRVIELVEVGPAHTQGDTLVFVPDAKTVYTGDILFIGGTPVVWVGPLDNWIAACDLICASDVEHIVPLRRNTGLGDDGIGAVRIPVDGEAGVRAGGGHAS